MSRLSLPPESEWSDAQRQAATGISAGPRGALFGPFVPLLHVPRLMSTVQRVGEYLRYEGAIPRDLFELTVLIVARHWNQEFEWGYHYPLALESGLPQSVIDDVEARRPPASGRPEIADVWEFANELLSTGSTSDDTLARVAVMGAPAVVELTTVVGYYTTLALVMNVDQTPAPEGAPRLSPEVP